MFPGAISRPLAAVLAASVLVAGCVREAPPSLACPGLTIDPTGADVAAVAARSAGAVLPTGDPLVETLAARLVERALPRFSAETLRTAEPTVEVLTMSTGGQWGAFGAGFLEAWERQGQRPERFDWISGVSAGGVLAPFVFAGGAHEIELREIWDGLDSSEVYDKNTLISPYLPVSVYDTAPFRETLRAHIGPELVGDLARGHASGRSLLLGAANLDTGRFDLFDVAAFAAEAPADVSREDCITEAVLATAAIPGAFPPRHINGDFYVDGGVRRHVFFQAVEAARAQMSARLQTPVRVNAYILINGDVRVGHDHLDELWLLPAALRSFTVVVDEGVRQSVREAVAFAQAQDQSTPAQTWTLRGIAAPRDSWRRIEAACEGEQDIDNDDIFSGCATATLFDIGQEVGSMTPIPWLDAEGLLRRVDDYTN